jgi:hypothetical protein
LQRASLHPFTIASRSIDMLATNIGAMLLAFAFPGILRVVMNYAAALANTQLGHGVVVPAWVLIVFEGLLAGLTIVPVACYVSLGYRPRFMPKGPVSGLLAAGLLIVVALLLIEIATASAGLPHLYTAVTGSTPFGGGEGWLWSLASSGLVFAVASLVCGAIYPALGLIAEKGTLRLRKYGRWLAHHFLGFSLIAAIILAILVVLAKIYVWLITLSGGGWLVAADGPTDPVHLLFRVLVPVPMDFLFTIIPGIAVGLIHDTIRSHEADP